MTTIMPDSELMRRAVSWISGQLEESGKSVDSLVEEASMRFNLGPKDEMFLLDFFKNTSKKQDKDPA